MLYTPSHGTRRSPDLPHSRRSQAGLEGGRREGRALDVRDGRAHPPGVAGCPRVLPGRCWRVAQERAQEDPMTKTWPLRLIDDKLRARLARGAVLRAEMQRLIALGQEPVGYRAR